MFLQITNKTIQYHTSAKLLLQNLEKRATYGIMLPNNVLAYKLIQAEPISFIKKQLNFNTMSNDELKKDLCALLARHDLRTKQYLKDNVNTILNDLVTYGEIATQSIIDYMAFQHGWHALLTDTIETLDRNTMEIPEQPYKYNKTETQNL